MMLNRDVDEDMESPFCLLSRSTLDSRRDVIDILHE